MEGLEGFDCAWVVVLVVKCFVRGAVGVVCRLVGGGGRCFVLVFW